MAVTQLQLQARVAQTEDRITSWDEQQQGTTVLEDTANDKDEARGKANLRKLGRSAVSDFTDCRV